MNFSCFKALYCNDTINNTIRGDLLWSVYKDEIKKLKRQKDKLKS
jgi:hypothetical protein